MNTKRTQLIDDGERMIPEFHKGSITYGEHLGRYLSVLDVVKGKVVLDIASGSGYGTKMLAGAAEKVYGVDIDAGAVKYAEEHYSLKGKTEYLVGSGADIPLKDNAVDVCVSMETIEHIDDQDKFIKELKRVTKTNGHVIISTPNDAVYPKGNHFHVREHSHKTLKSLLSKHFNKVGFFFQTVDISASVMDYTELGRVGKDKREIHKENTIKPDECIYYIVVCSDSNEKITLASNTVLGETYSHKLKKQDFDTMQELRVTAGNTQAKISRMDSINNELEEKNKLLNEENDLLKKRMSVYDKNLVIKIGRAIKSGFNRY